MSSGILESLTHISLSSVLATVVCFPIIYLTGIIFYNIYLHPLSSYPGPKYAAASQAWWIYTMVNGTFALRLAELHKKYGDVVRVAPNELSYINSRTWKDIYGYRNFPPEFDKDPREKYEADPEHPSILNADHQQHIAIRRVLSHAFSDKAMREQEPVLMRYADLLVQRLGEQCKDGVGEVDISRWLNYTTFDIIGHLIFHEPFDCLQSSIYHPWIEVMFDNIKYISYTRAVQTVPLLPNVLKKFLPKDLADKTKYSAQVIYEKITRRKACSPTYTDLMTHFLQAETKQQMVMEDLCAHAYVMVLAGSETTATLLSGVIYYLLKNPVLMDTLVAEVRGAFPTASAINISELGNLKYLCACLDEGLRIYPPAAMTFPRLTPSEGAMIDGKFVPGNTTIGMNTYAVHRNPTNFALPDSYIPERWLDDPRFSADKKEAMQAFSYGTRNCLGRHLAYLEMRLLLTKVLCEFDLELVNKEEQWEKQKVFVVWEKTPLMVKLKPVERK